MKRIFFLTVILVFLRHFSMAQETIRLYDKVPDNRPGVTRREITDTGKDGVIRKTFVRIPTLTVFHPDKTIDQHAVIIICPGGGYGHLAFNWEGTDIAKTLVKWGITAVVLKYRLPDDAIMIDKTIAPLQDAERAMLLVRLNAKKWDTDSGKTGIMGFSAGGHLASTLSTHYDEVLIDNPRKISLRPDFSILGYPVISFGEHIANKGSVNALLGKHPGDALIQKYSNELHVTKDTPPAFIVLANDDKGVNPLNSILYYEQLLKNQVAAEIHIYQSGGHGFGQDEHRTDDNWMNLLQRWLQHNHYLSPQKN